MKTLKSIKKAFLGLLGYTLISATTVHMINACAQTPTSNKSDKSDDRSESPYFLVLSENPETDQLPLQSTSADVNIAGVIADVTITQVYKNNGKNPIEAIYVFPASTRAAVYEMKMTIGEREIIAVVQEKDQARANYEQAKKDGKSASLLEQHRPNVFQMNVANIMPGDLIKVEMKYTELLIPTDGVYEFAYPTVVGPRYQKEQEGDVPSSNPWVSNPYTKEGVEPYYTFDINVNVNAGMPISDIRCNSHEVNINYNNATSATVALKNSDGKEGNKDYILQYKLTGNKVQSGLLLYQGKEENFFLAMIQPPKRVTPDQIPPREYVFIVDVSGSMYGFPIDISKKLLKNLISNLKPNDKFNVLLFAGNSSVLSETSLDANEANVQKAIQLIDNQQGGGATELLPALKHALSLKGTENYSRSFVIVTDGYVTVEKEAFDFIRQNLGNANFFSFGIGSSVNRYIIEGMAHVGKGEPFVITKPEEADAQAETFRKYIQTPVLTNIEVKMNGFQAYDVEPLSVPDVFAERPVILFGKWKGNASGTIELKGLAGNENYHQVLSVSNDLVSKNNLALRYLWARERIRLLDDYTKVDAYNQEHKKAITELGLKYNLLTEYTSFIAIDSEVRNNTGSSTTVKQPLPLPEGVSNYAVGGGNYPAASPSYSKTASGYGARSYKYSSKKDKVAESFEEVDDISSADYDVKGEEEKTEELVYASVEKMPVFSWNNQTLEDFIKANITYPADAKNSGTQGKVYVQLVVNPDGSISDVKIIRGIDSQLDTEALRVANLTSGKWTAGEKAGKKVNVQMIVVVNFKI